MPNNTITRADLSNNGVIRNIHYGDVLIKFGSVLSIKSDDIPFIKNTDTVNNNVFLKNGDIIIADTAEDETVGKVTEICDIDTEKVVSGLHTIPCRTKKNFAPKFLGYYMNSPAYHYQLFPLMQGVKVLSISKSNIVVTVIHYPDILQQTKIANLLSLIDKKISVQRQLVESLKKYKRGLLRDVFSRKIRLTKSDDEWKNQHIGDILHILHGRDYKEFKNPNGKYPVLGTSGIIDYSNKFLCNWSCVLIGRKGTIDRPQYMDTPFWTVDTLFYTKPKNGQDPKFQYYLFQTINWKKYNEASGVPSLSSSTIASIPISMPKIEVQNKIAKFFTLFDKKICMCESELKSLIKIKKALLQQLFI